MRTLLALLIISLTATANAQERLSAFPVNPGFSYQLEPGIFRANFPVDMSAFTVFYSRELKDGTLSVSPHVRYIDYLKSGQPVVGVPYYHSPFTWSSPILSFKLSNTSTKAAYLVQAHFDVTKSDANEMPIPVFHAFAQQGELVIENEGWGSLLNPSVNFAVVSNDDCLHPAQRALLLKNHPTNNIDAVWEFQIKDEVPEQLRHDAIVCVVGVLHYSVKGRGQLSTPFMTAVNLAPPTPSTISRLHIEVAGRTDRPEGSRYFTGNRSECLRSFSSVCYRRSLWIFCLSAYFGRYGWEKATSIQGPARLFPPQISKRCHTLIFFICNCS